MQKTSITIIGGGVIGCAIAYELSAHGYDGITVIERNSAIPGINQSSRNGGVIHSGLYYPKDIEPLKAKLCVEGNQFMYEFCSQYGLPYKKTGKLIIATNPREEEYLDYFLSVGNENGVPGLKKITASEVKTLEPNLSGVTCALLVPSTGVAALDPFVAQLKHLSEEKGVTFLTGTIVTKIESSQSHFRISCHPRLDRGSIPSENMNSVDSRLRGNDDTFETELLINAAGLYADDIAKMVNPDNTWMIVPARGELFQFDASGRPNILLNGMHVYQPPYCYFNDTGKICDIPVDEMKHLLKAGKITKTAGIHLSPVFDQDGSTYSMNHTYAVGPLKTLGEGKDDYMTNCKIPDDYVKRVNYFFPNLKAEDLSPRYNGIMAVLEGYTDFVIKKDLAYSNCIHLIGMDSPAWTSSLAIAKYIKINFF